MNRTPLSMPEIAIISGTRAALGTGAALLLGGRLSSEQRGAVGWSLVAVGAISTIPILTQLLSSRRSFTVDQHQRYAPLPDRQPEYAR